MTTPAAAALSGPGAGGGGAPAAPPAGGAPAGGGGGGAPGGAPAPGGAAFYDAIIPASDATKEAREWLGTKGFKDGAALVTSYRETERMANDLRSAANLKGYPVATVDPATGQPK